MASKDSQGSDPRSPVPRPDKTEQLGAQAAAAAKAAAAFYRGWRANRAPSNALQREQQRQLALYQQSYRAYRSRLARLRARLVLGGTAVVGGALVATTGEPAGLVVGGSAAALGAWQAVRGQRGLSQLEGPPEPKQIVAPPPSLPKGSPGAVAADRVSGIRLHLMELLPAVEQAHPEAAAQLRDLDATTAPSLAALVERIRALQRIQREFPGSPTAASADASIRLLADRLGEGATAYQDLLDGVIALVSAPDLAGPPTASLRSAIIDLQAYAAGLERAAETWN